MVPVHVDFFNGHGPSKKNNSVLPGCGDGNQTGHQSGESVGGHAEQLGKGSERG